jgi:hypothetical protein
MEDSAELAELLGRAAEGSQADWGALVTRYRDRLRRMVVLRLDPKFCVAYISRGNARHHRRDWLGLADYRMAFRIDPEEAGRELVRALTEGARRDPDEVLANSEQHLRISDRDVLAHARRGSTLVLLGREEEAAPHLDQLRAMVGGDAGHLDRVIELARRPAHDEAGRARSIPLPAPTGSLRIGGWAPSR